MGQRRQRAHRRASSRPTGRRSTSPARAMGTRKHGHGSLTGRAGPPGDRHRGDDGRRREHTRGRLLRGSRVAAGTPADGHHLRRLMPGTGKLCVCSWPCLEPHARQRGDRAVPNLPPPARAGTRAGLGGSAPIHALGHGLTPAVIRLCLRKSERVPSAAKPQTCGNEGPRRPPTAGTTHPGPNVSPGTGRVSKSALALRQIRLAGHSRDRTDTP